MTWVINKKLVNNYIEPKSIKPSKLKVEIDLPVNSNENQLKYSILTNSSDGQKIIYLRKKDSSKEKLIDLDEAMQKYAEEGEITQNLKRVKKAPMKNAKAFLTSSFPKEQKSESQKANKLSDKNTMGVMQRFSSATSKGNENILEIETLKSTSKDSRAKKSAVKKKCKKKSNLVNYLGK